MGGTVELEGIVVVLGGVESGVVSEGLGEDVGAGGVDVTEVVEGEEVAMGRGNGVTAPGGKPLAISELITELGTNCGRHTPSAHALFAQHPLNT